MPLRPPSSIRLKLALGFSVTVAVCGAVFAAANLAWARHSLRIELEEFARHETEEVANLVASCSDEHDLAAREALLQGVFPEDGVVSLEVWDLDGSRARAFPSPGPSDLPPWPEGLREARRDGLANQVLDLPQGTICRTAFLVRYAREPRWIVLAAVRRENAEADLRQLWRAYGAGLALAVLLAAVGGWVLVERALKPVQELVADASVIRREGPERRLAVPPEGSELRELALLLNGMLARLEETLGRLRRFAADAGHELRTPLARIQGEAELALLRGDPEQQRECLASVLEEVEDLRRVVDGLLLLARGEPLDLERETPFPLDELLGELVEQAGVVGRERSLQVALELSASPLVVRGSRALLSRALWNLLDNALKFTPAAGRIAVRLSQEGDEVQVEVADSGPGLGSDPERLFAPFVSDAPEGLRGHGLGLALSRAIAQRHGGEVHGARDPLLGGACLTLTIPASLSAASVPPDPAAVASRPVT